MAVITREQALIQNESWTRAARADGSRSFQQPPDTQSGVIVDDNGRLIVRSAGGTGFDTPEQEQGAPTVRYATGSALGYTPGTGLVQEALVIPTANTFSLPYAAPYIVRMFGYVQLAGWVQLVGADWSGGPILPVPGTPPFVSIAMPAANTNFVFGEWPLFITPGASLDAAVFIAFSLTGDVYTPGGANLWFSALGAL